MYIQREKEGREGAYMTIECTVYASYLRVRDIEVYTLTYLHVNMYMHIL